MRLLMTTALAALAIALGGCGQKTESMAPASSEQSANQAAAPAAPAAAPADWCKGHGVPESSCTVCNPELIPQFKEAGDWCEAHGYPESVCPTCNPQSPPTAGGAEPADWCKGHGVPESSCTVCNPELIPQFKKAGDWCEAHGYPESVCPTCNPQSPPTAGGAEPADWCIEHGLPESKCAKCNPALADQFKAAGDWCAAHGLPESACPICNPQQPPAGVEKAALEARTVRFRSPDVEAAAGIETVDAQSSETAATVSCTARISFDENRTADVRAIIPGIIRNVRVPIGAEVSKGAALFELESTEVSQIQGQLQTAREQIRTAQANLERQRKLHASDIASARQVELAEQELAAAQSQAYSAEATLRMAGASQVSPSGRYTLVAPLAGTVVRRPAVVGVLATAETSLATIADTSTMWALCDVPESDAFRVSLGQKMYVTIGDSESLPGIITWIAAEVDPRTRTLVARADLSNPHGRLKANQFASARIETRGSRNAVSVPRSAVQRVDKQEVVFVRTAQGVYEPRVVERLGGGPVVQVLGRIAKGDAVVTTGAVLLRTEIMPGSIGAGCCEVEPVTQARN